MMDETFHLTPLDVRRYEFGKALRGYDPERVNQFRDQVAEELERLSRINQDLETKARGFHEQLRAFRASRAPANTVRSVDSSASSGAMVITPRTRKPARPARRSALRCHSRA